MAKKCELRKNYIHCRKESPKKFDKRSFRVKQSGKVKIVVGCPKGKYDPKKKKCRVGTMIQKIMYPATSTNKQKHLKEKVVKVGKLGRADVFKDEKGHKFIYVKQYGKKRRVRDYTKF